MSHAAVAAVDRLGVNPIQLTHAGREIAFGGFNDQMIVIGHLAPGVYLPVEALAALRQNLEPGEAILIVLVDIFPAVTARGDMVESASKLYTKGT